MTIKNSQLHKSSTNERNAHKSKTSIKNEIFSVGNIYNAMNGLDMGATEIIFEKDIYDVRKDNRRKKDDSVITLINYNVADSNDNVPFLTFKIYPNYVRLTTGLWLNNEEKNKKFYNDKYNTAIDFIDKELCKFTIKYFYSFQLARKQNPRRKK